MEERNFYGFNIPGRRNPNPLWSILMGVFFLVVLFFLARFIFRILYFLSPIFLIAALIIDYKVVLNYGKWLVKMVKQNPIMGIGAIVLSIFGFPLVSVYLLGRALFNKRIKDVEQEFEKRTKGEMVDFEEIDSEPLRLRELEEDTPKRKESNEYEDLF
jgi:hypothetical protein